MTFIKPTWPAPAHIQAVTTSRLGGLSSAPYDTFNLAEHVGDDIHQVAKNRLQLQEALGLPLEPIWLQQTHSTIVLPALPENRGKEADASYTNLTNHVCAVLTADCLPVLLCNATGTHIAAIHAGWRGLANGIIEQTVFNLNTPTDSLLAWLGPAISQPAFEVGADVRSLFLTSAPELEHAFIPSPRGRWLADLYALATHKLQKLGIHQIYGGSHCTYSDKTHFYSYRRDGEKTGRMATLIWIMDSRREN